MSKRTVFISNFDIINNAPAWINFDEGRVVMESTSSPRPSPQGEGSLILLYCKSVPYHQYVALKTTISPLQHPLLEERAG
jgi:hypothetical protein